MKTLLRNLWTRIKGFLGFKPPVVPKRQLRNPHICPYCKNHDTTRLNGVELIPYEQYHKGNPFRAYECSCGARFHFSMN